MTPERLRAALDELCWSQRDLASLLPCNERLVRRWVAGEAGIPPDVAGWIATRLDVHRAHPPPTDWKRRRAA